MKKIITFVIVCYHPDLKKLDGMRRALKGYSVVIIDNTKINLGYGGGANLGIERAFRLDSDWVVIMNQDLILRKDTPKQLESVILNCTAGIVGVSGGSLDKKRWTTILPSKKLDYISGSCIAIHKNVIDKIGYFHEPYFMYYEDVDYSIKAKKAGFPLILKRIQGIIHDDNPSLGKGSYLYEYYLSRNHLLFIEREAPLGVKIYEYIRMIKTLIEYKRTKNYGALEGIKDYFGRKFGEKI